MKALANFCLLAHPFIFALLPIILFLNYVRDQILPEEVFASAIALEVVTLIFMAVLWLVSRSPYRASIACSAWLVTTFSYRIFETLVGGSLSGIIAAPIFLLVFLALQLFFVFAILRGRWDFAVGASKQINIEVDSRQLSGSLSLVALILLAVNFIPLYGYEKSQDDTALNFKEQLSQPFKSLKLEAQNYKPDIYYLILDGYANAATMSEFWHEHDDRLQKFLTSRNFYLPERAACNYDRTEFSLASSLNMQYLNPLLKAQSNIQGNAQGNLCQPSSYAFMRLVQDSQTIKLLHSLGYRFILSSSGSFGTDIIPQADQTERVSLINHFARALISLTPWSDFESFCPFLANTWADVRLSPGLELDRLTAVAGPKFVLIHTDLPHAPYLFDRNGRRLKLPPGLIPDWQPAAAYFEQWQFCQTNVISWIDKIMTSSKGRAIIIVQSDHGPGIRMIESSDWYNERMRILNAYYLPDSNGHSAGAGLYASVSPVNSFRVVFNQYFKAGLPILKDISYCPSQPRNAFDWQDVTAKLHFNESKISPMEPVSP